jgi:hypothetical protein
LEWEAEDDEDGGENCIFRIELDGMGWDDIRRDVCGKLLMLYQIR